MDHRAPDIEPATRVVEQGDRLVRVPDPAAASSRGGAGGFVICVLVGLVAYFYFDFRWWTAIIAGVLAPVGFLLGILAVVLLIGLVAAPFYHLERRRRNRELRRLVTALLSGTKEKRIILYLRQFRRQGWKFSVGLTKGVSSPLDNLQSDRYFMESWADELSTDGVHVVKVADRTDATIAGSFRLDDSSWRADVLRLMAAADAILLVPGTGEGLLWEITQIRAQNKVGITTIVMPFGAKPAQSEQVWESCRTHYRARGFELPPFSADGLLMKFSDSGELASAIPLLGTGADEMRSFILDAVTSRASPIAP